MPIILPELPVPISDFVHYADQQPHTQVGVGQAVEPFKAYENKLREIYAQHLDHPAVSANHLVSIFETSPCTTRARDLNKESADQKDAYLLSLPDDLRRKHGSPATVQSLKDFRTNFTIFSESSLTELKWDNVVVAGSAVNTSLLPLNAPYSKSKRALRNYYHDKLAPASDVDLFLYGLNEEEAVEKIKQIETSVRDSILAETTTVRTKNAITIVSEYPVRHVQIVLRLYKSISEILTGFDVDSSCVAYDGQHVWASPRAVAAFMTQVNSVDLTRRSPSYENRLSKYSHRGFEVHWPLIDRKRIDPTIYERSFSRVQGLARLLVLEKLPHPTDRDDYLAKRREERGRPPLYNSYRFNNKLAGNLKDVQPDDVAEWVEEDDVSNYHTVSIPYGPRYNAKRVEKLLFTKDLLLNAEWNKPKDRETNLHRHPAFFGLIDDIVHDCCGFCPKATTDADLAALEDERKIYISGGLTFLKDDPGRQSIGSFNPITNEDWTEMAYVGNTTRLCQAIVDQDIDAVRDWFSSPEVTDVNRRDHTGRTPLQLAAMCSIPEVVQVLIEHGARLVSRLYNGMTALHIAAHRGNAQIVKDLLEKSAANEQEESRKEVGRKIARRAAAGLENNEGEKNATSQSDPGSESGEDDEEWKDEDTDSNDSMTEGSFIKVREKSEVTDPLAEDKDDPDVYDVDVLAWDNPLSPLHLAILAGNIEVIELLIDEYGADVLLPVKIMHDYDRKSAKAAILTLVLALELPLQQANITVKSLLAHGATSTQADMNHISALHYAINSGKTLIVDTLQNADPDAVSKAINFVSAQGYRDNPSVQIPLLTAIRTGRKDLVEKLVEMGADIEVPFAPFEQAYKRGVNYPYENHDDIYKKYQSCVEQPIILAAKMQMLDFVDYAIEHGVNVNTIEMRAWRLIDSYQWGDDGRSLLDIVRNHIKELKEALYPQHSSKPDVLQKDEHYLDFPKDSYQYWTAYHDLKDAKLLHRYQFLKCDQKNKLPGKSDQNGILQKNAAMEKVLTQLTQIENKLCKRGAKSFYDIHPKAHRNTYNARLGSAGMNDAPYETSISFVTSDVLGPERKAERIQLFEACWNGDVETVKSLCLSTSGALEVAVKDLHGFSPFSIAVLRGYHDLAQLIIEIATVQYKPASDSEKYRYTLRTEKEYDDDSDCDSENSHESEVGVLAHLVQDNFTVDDIATLADHVQSKVSPLKMLTWGFPGLRAVRNSAENEEAMRCFTCLKEPRPYAFDDAVSSWQWFNAALMDINRANRDSLVIYAIATNDLRLLRFILKIGHDLAQQTKDDGDLKVYPISTKEFQTAIRLGRVEMIGEILKATGFGFPLQKIFQKSGVQLERSPEYYQGLTVHGKKRQQFVDAARTGSRSRYYESDLGVPLLASILQGNLESAEYFFSDSPSRRYLEFANTIKDDKRIQGLSKTDGGVEGTVISWLATRNNLAMHMAVLSPPNQDGSQPILDYLLKKAPEWIDVRSADGKTPLFVAFEAGRYHSARMLIDAGADQTTRDTQGRNILHVILSDTSAQKYTILRPALEMLDQKLVPSLLTERCGIRLGTTTPLVSFLNQCAHSSGWEDSLTLILKYTDGKDLEKMNGAGDYPLHTVVRSDNSDLVKFLVHYRPELLYQENATGMTPAEVVATLYIRTRIENPPAPSSRDHWSVKDSPAESFLPKDKYDIDGNYHPDDDDDNGIHYSYNRNIGPARRMHHLINQLVNKFPAPRKLVSLHDANEVAKRLAFLQQKKSEEDRRHADQANKLGDQWAEKTDKHADEQALQDEVTDNLVYAPIDKDWGWLNWRKEIVKEEGIEEAIEKQRRDDNAWLPDLTNDNPFFAKSGR
ncbi:hypothetical protein LTR84_012212 [Exophiala bonariae]|uniref:Ankyrin repeat protein n=1 Tax=Exophiala bonariae TaxID=1690606 RepID=A0AAV9NJ80_9EURO|nr:hypothetical protein LTR84_012212 [Exophiala bonariae]